MSPPRLHLDEHLSPRLAQQLRQHGFDVTSTVETDMLADSDEEQLAYAAAERRALVTCNFADFMALHKQYFTLDREHWGIILSTQESVNVLCRRLLRLLDTLSEEDLKNQIRWLNEFGRAE